MIKAVWNDETIAESNDTISLEGNYYFPPESVSKKTLTASAKQTTCPFKGVASYYDVTVNGKVNESAAWYYPEPKEGFEKIANHVAFWQGVKII